jgi:hypothetical protein
MSAGAGWSKPSDVRQQVQRLWDDGRILAARVDGSDLFPFEMRLRQPTTADIGDRFDAVRNWVREWEQSSGFDIAWREINHRQTGRNSLPERAVVATEDGALRLIGRGADACRFDQLASITLEGFPQLRPWLARRALLVLEQAAQWPRILAILRWFVAHPRPGIYLRQLDIAGVDSKFIEGHKALLAELLDQVLPAAAIRQDAVGARQFETRYGLLGKPALIRMRILDPALYIAGLSDIAVPVGQFARLEFAARRVFITENEINGLAFPDVPGAIVVFGGGYGVERLAAVPWLHDRELVYWGDIDTHGFAILDRLRASAPHARSLMMDVATLHAHRTLWGREALEKRYTGDLLRLTDDEQALYQALRNDIFGEQLRLEQERIGYGWVRESIARV